MLQAEPLPRRAVRGAELDREHDTDPRRLDPAAGTGPATDPGPVRTRTSLVFTLLLAWALRLSIYITWRNWGEPEDRRYQAIRARNQPHHAIKSLFYVFSLHGSPRRR